MTTVPPDPVPAPGERPLRQRARARFASLLPFGLLMLAFHGLVGPFFPNLKGGLGHDYSGILPLLLAGRYWFDTNGLFAVPWFTPAFCGGQPLFPDPQTFYYSLPQFLAFVLDPLKAVYLSILLFAAAGYWGSYWLMRRAFGTSRPAAVVSATLFMFNGFFVYRMVIGHFTYNAFMLLPAMAALILLPQCRARRLEQDLLLGTLAGLAGGYWVYSGMLHMLLPGTVAFLCIGLLHRLYRDSLPLGTMLMRAGIASVVTAGLSAAKLAAASSYMAGFPRTDYLLPGMKDLGQLGALAAKLLFFPSPNIHLEAGVGLANVQWALGRHEFEYGVGVAALALLLWGLIALIPPLFSDVSRAARARRQRTWVPSLLVLALLALCAIPFALNLYTPEWNALLKQIPLIKSSSNLFRWFALLIPVITVTCGLVFNRIAPPQQGRLALVLVFGVLLANFFSDRLAYHAEGYSPEPVTVASTSLAQGEGVPPVKWVLADLADPASGRLRGVSGFPNDQLVGGYSPLACYNPIFGYRLEHFPVKSLHDGDPTEARDGLLNFKNPACYAFPGANQCAPGDHFREGQLADLQALLAYRPYPFVMPASQEVANGVTLGVLLLCAALLCILAWRNPGALRGSA